MKAKLLIVLAILLFAGVAITLLRPDDTLYPVNVEVTRGPLAEKLMLTGELINQQYVVVTALIDGQIEQLDVSEGQLVEASEIVARLNSDLIEGRLGKANAQLAYNQQQLETARMQHERMKRLQRSNNVSRHKTEDALAAVKSAEALVAIAQADVDLALLEKAQSTITAPFSGTVIKRTADEGQWVEAGTALFTLASDSGRVIEAVVDASDLSRISVGQATELKAEAWPDQKWESTVDWIAPVIGSSSIRTVSPNSFAIRISPGADAPPLLIGQQVDVTLQTAFVDDTVSIPLSALHQSRDGRFHVWIEQDGKSRSHAVETGMLTMNRVQIVSGLKAGDSVLQADGAALYEGANVEFR